MPERSTGHWRYLDGTRVSWRLCGHLCEAGRLDSTGAGAYRAGRVHVASQTYRSAHAAARNSRMWSYSKE